MAPETSKSKILVIEDDAFMVELLARELQESGFEVLAATQGAQGVELFEKEKPDLLLLDILLPDLDGFEVFRRIRRMPGGPEVKVIVLSNTSEAQNVEEATRLGAVEYILKATRTLPEIVQSVKSALNIK